MAVSEATGSLLVMEYGGTGRSGKGTIVDHISSKYKKVTSDETGADYRTVTKYLLDERHIDPEMSGRHIGIRVAALGAAQLTEMVANKRQIIGDENPKNVLYTGAINGIVQYVSQVPETRAAIKNGFARRVERVRDDFEADVLLVDGRNLGPLVERIEGTQLLMRTFVHCAPAEAALRECTRLGISMSDERAETVYRETLEAVLRRNAIDANRDLDPVRVDEDAINYWQTSGAVGSIAVQTGRQIDFDTTVFRRESPDDPRTAMLSAAESMFNDALATVGAPRAE